MVLFGLFIARNFDAIIEWYVKIIWYACMHVYLLSIAQELSTTYSNEDGTNPSNCKSTCIS